MTAPRSARWPSAARPSLRIGVISAGRVGTAIAEACIAAGHEVIGIYCHSASSATRAAARIPTVPQVDFATAASAQFVILAVPDPHLGMILSRVSAHTSTGSVVVHTSGAHGCAIMQPVTDTGALPLALHPAMTFIDEDSDARRVSHCAWGVTADSDIGAAVATAFIESLGGTAHAVPEERRIAYHAALAHGANHIVTLIADALTMLDGALNDGTETSESAAVLGSLVRAAVDNTLDQRRDALTGPIARDDDVAVARHLRALADLPAGDDLVRAYLRMAERTAAQANAVHVEHFLDLDARPR